MPTMKVYTVMKKELEDHICHTLKERYPEGSILQELATIYDVPSLPSVTMLEEAKLNPNPCGLLDTYLFEY